MPLINFKTNLTSLKYGLDEPGGGYSGQPFLQLPIPDASTPQDIQNFYTLNRTSLDFPIRGGSITSLVNGSYTSNSAIFDAERISAFLKSAPRGNAFIEKQVGLQLTNPRLQVQNTVNLGNLSFSNLANVVLPVTNAYDPLNTLAQVAVMGTGAHFNRQGVLPTLFEDIQSTYQYIVGAPQNNTEVTNRLTILKAIKLFPNSNFQVSANNINNIGIDPDLVDRLGISTIQNQLFNYQGGPGSVYGIGSTIIRRATNPDGSTTSTDAASIPPAEINGFYVGGVTQAYSTTAFTYLQLAQQNTRTQSGTTVNLPGFQSFNGGSFTTPSVALSPMNANIQDFRAQTNNGNPIIPSSDYTVYNIAKNYNGQGGLGIGNPGSPSTNKNYRVSKGNAIDRVNNLNPFYYNAVGTGNDPWTVGGNDTKDIIKFAFECIDNDDPNFSVALLFRAFFDGQISDSNTAEFNSFKYLGRGETFRTYQGFDRTIAFSFKIFAQTRQEMVPLYQKLNNLISQVYPDYSPTYNLMRGNVVRLTIGDYIYRMPGFLESVNVSIDNGNTPWDIVLGGKTENDIAQLPMMVTVQCSFKPIMDILPRKVSKNATTVANVELIANRGSNTNGVISDAILDKSQGQSTLASTPASQIPNLIPANTNLTSQQIADRSAAAANAQNSYNKQAQLIPNETPEAVVLQPINLGTI